MPDSLHAYRHVSEIYFPIAVGVFAVIVLSLAVLLVVGAHRRERPLGQSGAPRLELLYVLALVAVAAFLVIVTFRAETPLDRTVARPALAIKVTAAQWSWRFEYPGGVSVTAVSTWQPPVAEVPTGVEVEFAGSSRDVIHGFWVPQLHFQRQLLSGYVTRFDLRFDAAGRYGGECSVFCGEQHSQMHFAIEAVSPSEFQAWYSRQRAQPGGAA